jgi:uncharacterized protein (DUF2384 family)
MKLQTIENFLQHETVFNSLFDDQLDLPVDVVDQFVRIALAEGGMSFLLSALSNQNYYESFATDFSLSVLGQDINEVARVYEKTQDVLRNYANFILDQNVDIAIAAQKRFAREYEKDQVWNAMNNFESAFAGVK